MRRFFGPIASLTCKRLIIYCVSFVAVFFIGIALDLACGPEPDPYDYYASFFHNTLPGNNDYRPFYFNGLTFLNDEQEQFSESEINASEWALYLGSGVKATDVEHAMYKLGRHVDSALLVNNLKQGIRLPDSLRKNTFLKKLVSGDNVQALHYYRFVKTIENIEEHGEYNQWDPRPTDTVLLEKNGRLALSLANKENDNFIKLRYYYQAERLFHYSGKIKEAVNVYNMHISKIKSTSHVMGWALALKAGEEWKLNNDILSAYLFSKVFALYPERRVQAYLNFIAIKQPAKSIIELAANDNEKANIFAIEGFHNSHLSLEALQNVYRYQPSSPLVEALLIREINKLEEGYSSPKLYSALAVEHKEKEIKTYRSYISVLKVFCQKLAKENKTIEPGLGGLALSYLSWMQEKSREGINEIATLDKMNLSPRFNDQKHMIKLLLLSQKIKRINKAEEKELLPSLYWLDKKVQWENKAYANDNGTGVKRFSASSRDFYALILANAYLKQKDTAMAALAILKSEHANEWYPGTTLRPTGADLPDFWKNSLHSHTLVRILKWKNSSKKNSPYLNLALSTISKNSMDAINDLLGTVYLREHNYTKAAKAFSLIDSKIMAKRPHDYWNDNPYNADPFKSQLADYPKTYLADSTKGYNKLMFARAMAGLHNKIKTDPKNAATYYYKLATGLYNTSFYGNAWYFITYSWSALDLTEKQTHYYSADYLFTTNAEKYYLKAKALSHDKEFKAKCTFIAAKCGQKQVAVPENYYYSFAANNKYIQKMRANPYFADLKNNYPKTRFYKIAVNECSYFRDFLSPPKPKPVKKEIKRVIVVDGK